MRLSFRTIVVIFVVIALLGFLTYSVVQYRQSGIEEHGLILEERPGYRAVHWHVKLIMSACDKKLKLPLERGTPLLHTHKDAEKIHIEGLIEGPRDATLGKFMEAVGVPFSQNRLFDYINDNMCKDADINSLRMIVNGQLNEQFENYPLSNGDVVELIYD